MGICIFSIGTIQIVVQYFFAIMDTDMQNMESPESPELDVLSAIVKLQSQVQKNTDTIISLFKDHSTRIHAMGEKLQTLETMGEKLQTLEDTLKRIDSITTVNQELIQANVHFNSACKETEIPNLPPLKLETKLKVKVEQFGESLLLLGQTFDIKDKLKEIASARYNSTPSEKKGWLIQNEQLPNVLSQLSDICEFDTALIQ